MKTALLFLFAICAYCQTCVYQTGKFPNGQVLVYRNGAIQRQGPDFSVKAGLITPINFAPGDSFSTVFSIQIPLTSGTTSYISYRIWQENWTCPGTSTAPPLILPTATFATPPANPQLNQAYMFTDSSPFDSCSAGGDGTTPQICYWNGTQWSSPQDGTQAPVAVQVLPGGARAVRWLECFGGIVDKSLLTVAGPSQEITILTGLNGTARFEHVTLCERDRFTGQSVMTVSMGRPGTNDYELSGAVVPLGSSGNNAGCWTARPDVPQFSGTYSVVLNFSVSPGSVTDLSAGSVEWEACMYPSLIGDPGILMTPAKLVGLQQCSGSGPGFDCAGMFSAKIKRADGSILPIVGPMMTPPPAAPVIWTDIK